MLLGEIGNGESWTISGWWPNTSVGWSRCSGELGAEPGELLGGERAGIAAVAGLVVGVDAEDAQALQVAAEVRRLVAREELVVEAVVALPLADAARGVRVADVRAVVVAARDEVVAAVRAEPLEQLARLAQVDRHGLGRDVAGREQVTRAERARRRRRATRA